MPEPSKKGRGGFLPEPEPEPGSAVGRFGGVTVGDFLGSCPLNCSGSFSALLSRTVAVRLTPMKLWGRGRLL